MHGGMYVRYREAYHDNGARGAGGQKGGVAGGWDGEAMLERYAAMLRWWGREG